MPYLNEPNFIQNAQISENGEYGFYISDKEQKVFYLHKDGRIRSGATSDNGRTGYWEKKDQAEWFLEGWIGAKINTLI